MSSPPTPPSPIGTLLRVKQAAEEAAARRWHAATTRRAAAEASQRALDDRVRAARADLRARRAQAAGAVTLLAGSGADRERFWVDRRAQIAAGVAQADAHRQGALADALAEVAAAMAAHLAARAAREQIQKLCEKADTARRTVTERREEIALDEQSQATRKI
jgi:hypothetical protein